MPGQTIGCPISSFARSAADGKNRGQKAIEQTSPSCRQSTQWIYRGTSPDRRQPSSQDACQDLLRALARWNDEHRRPFDFLTQAHECAEDDEISPEGRAGFHAMFVGAKRRHESLKMTKKQHNIRRPLQRRSARSTKPAYHPLWLIIGSMASAWRRLCTSVRRRSRYPQAMLAVHRQFRTRRCGIAWKGEGRMLLVADKAALLRKRHGCHAQLTTTRPVREIAKVR